MESNTVDRSSSKIGQERSVHEIVTRRRQIKTQRVSERVEWVDSITQIPIESFERCFQPPLEGYWWYHSLEFSGLDAQFTFSYALVYRNDIIAAIAPVFVMNVPMELVAPEAVVRALRLCSKVVPGVDHQRTLFVGSPCTDEGTVGLMPGVSLDEVLPLLLPQLKVKAKAQKASVIAWKDFVEHDCEVLDALTEDCYFKIPSYPGTVVDLPKGGFEDYLNSIKRHRRHNLRRNIKRGKQAAELDVSVIQNPNTELRDEIFGLFWQTYENGKTKFERLTPEFFRLISDAECAHYILLREKANGRLVAFMLCFKVGERVINKFIGLDYNLNRDWFLYARLWEAAVSWVMSLGCREIQSGQTGYRPKIDIGNRLVPLFNYCLHLNPLMNLIYSKVSRTITWSTLDDDLKEHLAAHPEELPAL